MKFKVQGVDAKTGKPMKPIIVEVDGEAAAAIHAKSEGVVPSEIKEYTEPSTHSKSMVLKQPIFFAPFILSMIGALFWFGSMVASQENLIVAGSLGISGSIFIVGAQIIAAVNEFHPPVRVERFSFFGGSRSRH